MHDTAFDPEFDDRDWTPDWMAVPIAPVPAMAHPSGYRVERRVVQETEIFGQPYRLTVPFDCRLLFDPAGRLWMSDTPQERIMMYNNAGRSCGHVLVGGAGLGLYPQYVAEAASFTIIERSPIVLRLVAPLLQEIMDARGVRLRFLVGDVETYLARAEPGGYDTIFLDTWERLDATLLPAINRLRDMAARHLAPDGRVLLWGYRWMVRLFEEACATLLIMPPEERGLWLAEQRLANPRAAALLAPIARVFEGKAIRRWELDEAVRYCREWVWQVTV